MADFDREKWLTLAYSSDAVDRAQAFEIAKAHAASLQYELLYWFGCHTDFSERMIIYELLEASFQSQALSLIGDKQQPVPFDRTRTFELFLNAKDFEMQQAIIALEQWYMKPTDIKNALVLAYKERKKCDLQKAQKAVRKLYGDEDENTEVGGPAPEDITF